MQVPVMERAHRGMHMGKGAVTCTTCKLNGLAWQASRTYSRTKLGVELLDIHSRSGGSLRLHPHNTAGSRTALHRGRPESGGGTPAGRSGGRFGGGRLAAASAARARAMACRCQIAAGSTPSPAGGGVGAGAHGPAHGAHGLHGAGSAAGGGASATNCRSGRFQLGQGTQSHVLCPRCGGGGRRRRMPAVGEWLGPQATTLLAPACQRLSDCGMHVAEGHEQRGHAACMRISGTCATA